MSVFQVCPSWRKACGIANFAANVARLTNVTTSTAYVPTTEADVVLYQHEFGLYDADKLTSELRGIVGMKRLVFAHTSKVDLPCDGYLSMAYGMTPTNMPTTVLRHPGYYREPLDRDEIKRKYGLDQFAGVVTTSGYLSPNRKTREIVQALLPFATARNWLVLLLCSKHQTYERHQTTIDEANYLQWLASVSGNLWVCFDQKTPEQLNELFQGSDLVWCYTAAEARPYASGVASDQWTSGTRIVINSKPQHWALYGKDNVAWSGPDLPEFLSTLDTEMRRTEFPRHDGSELSWEAILPELARAIDG